jgi:hypothetical protein
MARRQLPLTLTALTLVGAVIGTPIALRAGTALTAQEVACNADQLRALLERTKVTIPNDPLRVTAAYASFGSTTGGITILARTHFDERSAANRQPEKHLWVSLNPDENSMLRNDQRAQLPTAGAARSRQNTDLVAAADSKRLELTLNPTLNLVSPDPASLLVVNNLLESASGSLQAASRPGRGLIDVVAPCADKTAGKLTGEDIHVFRVLQKILISQTRLITANNARAPGVKTAIFRGEAPDIYLVDIYPVDAAGQMSLGKARFVVTVVLGAGGRLDGGRVDVDFANSDATYTVDFWLLEPLFGQTPFQGEFAEYAFRHENGSNGQSNPQLDWDQLLPDLPAGGGLHPWRKPLS